MTPTTSALQTQQFMQLLVAQIQNQDPLEPISNESFLAQLAQFSSLESLERLNEQFSAFSETQQLAQATDLLGHLATYDSGSRQQGMIEAVRVGRQGIEAQVDSEWVSVSRLESVDLPSR